MSTVFSAKHEVVVRQPEKADNGVTEEGKFSKGVGLASCPGEFRGHSTNSLRAVAEMSIAFLGSCSSWGVKKEESS